MRRRPVPVDVGAVARLATVAATVAAAAALVAGCAPATVEIGDERVGSRDRRACTELVAALPEELADQPARDTDARLGAAWGDPPIVLRCGVPGPPEFDELSTCQVVDGVAWFIPEEQITGEARDLTMTTVGREPGVEVTLPEEYFPPAAAMAQLADAVGRATTEVESCG